MLNEMCSIAEVNDESIQDHRRSVEACLEKLICNLHDDMRVIEWAISSSAFILPGVDIRIYSVYSRLRLFCMKTVLETL
jgi:hypothetical protein